MASHHCGDERPRPAPETAKYTCLMPVGGGDGEQAAAADLTQAGLVALADLALNHRMTQGAQRHCWWARFHGPPGSS